MSSRRDFLKRAALLAAGGGLTGGLSESIWKAFAIDPPAGSTYLDAEHVVILMQENRSFDHSYGSLRGVRGFNDPRAVTLPNGNPVWLQSRTGGGTYSPFRLNLMGTKATWMSSLPHSWVDQVDARHDGRHDGWLDAKVSGHEAYAQLPLTLGFYNREDLPFYYALADAFTVCDQNFCSSLTGTTPNRLHLWTGTIRERPTPQAKANVRNEDVDFGSEAGWKTFPERLEDHGISWRVYQNELSLDTGLEGERDAWLSNFTDNPLEWFSQYHVRLSNSHVEHLAEREAVLAAELARAEAQPQPWTEPVRRSVEEARKQLSQIRRRRGNKEGTDLSKLSPREQNLHRKAFTTNAGDPDYRELTTLTYRDGGIERPLQVPKGDVLYQFRQDVRSGALPAVSWIVAPENFSDHPGAPWYGAWYLSEVLDILTQNADVWRKTIFILCYDENDGYFDHVPPFVPPHPDRQETGKVSAGIDTSVEHVRWEQEAERQRTHPGAEGREGPIGLGYRVPLVIASPWSRGGYVCSQVYDHTSILQFMEGWLSQKTGRALRESNISAWRRTVCGDLSAAFRPWRGEKIELPSPVDWTSFAGAIHQAQFRELPHGFKERTASEQAQARDPARQAPWLPQQEPGVRPACALPYELSVDGALGDDRQFLELEFSAGNRLFGERAAGAPFHVYSPVEVRVAETDATRFEAGRTWSFAVAAGRQVSYRWPLRDFARRRYHLRVHGPNGFYREFQGGPDDPALSIRLDPVLEGSAPTGHLVLTFACPEGHAPRDVRVEDAAYRGGAWSVNLGGTGDRKRKASLVVDLGRTFGWYDLRIRVEGAPAFERRCAGRLETGKEGFSDPLMGRAIG